MVSLFDTAKRHIPALKFLAYIVVVFGLNALAIATGLLPMTLLLDPTHLCVVVLAFYYLSEILSIRIHWGLNKDSEAYKGEKLFSHEIDNLERKLERKISYLQFANSVLITLGLIGTVVGICLTVWPFLTLASTGTALTIANMQPLFGKVFAGAGAALLPSVYSIIASLFLSFNARLSENTVDDIISDLRDNEASA